MSNSVKNIAEELGDSTKDPKLAALLSYIGTEVCSSEGCYKDLSHELANASSLAYS